MAQFAFRSGYPIRPAEEKPQFKDVWRIRNAVGGALLNRAEHKRPVFCVAKHQNRRVTRLRADIVQKAQACLFGLVWRLPQIKQHNIGPGKEFLKMIDPTSAISSERKSISEGPGNCLA